MTHRIARAAVMVMLVLLAGCATSVRKPSGDPDSLWQQQQQKLAALTNWELAGRISIQLESEGWSASLYWQQDHAHYQLRIVAPLGRGTVEIAGDDKNVRLHTADNRVLENGAIDEMMRENLGWEVPVDALVYWIRGLPQPGAPAENLQLDEQGRVMAMQQSGWTIQYERYTNSEGFEVPARMTVQREHLRLRLNINRWTLPDVS